MDVFEDTAYDSNGANTEAEDSPDIIASSPPEAGRSAKRRRVESSTPSISDQENIDDDDEYDLPSYDGLEQETEEQNARNAKYLMHDPEHEEPIDTVFVTQLTQDQHSSPSRIRGPRWRKKAPSPPPDPQTAIPPPPAFRPIPAQQAAIQRTYSPDDEFDDDTLDAAFADSDIEELDATIAASLQSNATGSKKQLQKSTSFRQQTLFGTQAEEKPATQTRAHNWPLVESRNDKPTHHKLDVEAMKTWVYPTNLGKPRDYQFNIVQSGLYHNLLVALPTGLGKTFIAATIMLNWFRWTEDAQIVFVAPTKPLVHQQVDACFNIVGIPRSQTTMLTGEVAPAVRAEEWKTKRVFFMTPQTLINDYKHGYADPKRIVLLVVDEAHRATGGYAYVEVVQFLRRFNTSFRVLALTATPGATVEAVQKVVDGLDIARVEIRTEQSLDIREYVHARNLEIELFDYSDEINMCLELFSKAVKPIQDKLVSQNAYWGRDPTMISVFGLNQARAQWMKSEAGRKAQGGIKGMVNTIFSVLMSLAHALTLLKFHGIGPFYHKLKAFQDMTKAKYALQIQSDDHFKKLMGTTKTWINNPEFVGHPKLLHLKSVVLNHFMDAGEGTGRAGGKPPSETRIMVFAHFRDSAEEIVRVLNRHGGMVRAKVFVGQASAKGSEGMDQKSQLAAIKDFKTGIHNVLVATSVGEEGLDIGEVDLIICYDASASPIRMLQRMGRTGRKRTGNIEVLLMRGKEENDFTKSRDSYEKMQKIIAEGSGFNFHFDKSPRIVPRGIDPVVDKRIVEIPFENTQAEPIQPTRRAKKPKPPKKFHIPDDAQEGFHTAAGKKISKAANQTKNLQKQFNPTKLDTATAKLLSLDAVLLTDRENSQLDQTYGRVPGDEDQLVQVPSLHAPSTQRKPQPVIDVQHSRLTRNLTEAFASMRDPRRDWRTPKESDVDSTLDSTVLDYSDIEELEAPKRSTKRKAPCERLSTKHSSGTVLDEDAYDLHAEFVDDGELKRIFSEDRLDDDEEELPSLTRTKPAEIPQPYFVSQRSVTNDDGDDDEELPDFNTLVGKVSGAPSIRFEGANERKKKPTRRVLDDDSDE